MKGQHQDTCNRHAQEKNHGIWNEGSECEKDKPSTNQNAFPVERALIFVTGWTEWAVQYLGNFIGAFIADLSWVPTLPGVQTLHKPADKEGKWHDASADKLFP